MHTVPLEQLTQCNIYLEHFKHWLLLRKYPPTWQVKQVWLLEQVTHPYKDDEVLQITHIPLELA